MVKNGYIRLQRSVTDWEWYKDIPTKVLFFHILLNARWKATTKEGIEIPSGALDVTLNQLAEDTGLTTKQIRRSLKNLESTNEICYKRAQQIGRKFSVISIVKWQEYQVSGHDEGTMRARRGHDEGTLMKKERKKECNNYIYKGKPSAQKNKFNNFDERVIDYEQLERKLMEQ